MCDPLGRVLLLAAYVSLNQFNRIGIRKAGNVQVITHNLGFRYISCPGPQSKRVYCVKGLLAQFLTKQKMAGCKNSRPFFFAILATGMSVSGTTYEVNACTVTLKLSEPLPGSAFAVTVNVDDKPAGDAEKLPY